MRYSDYIDPDGSTWFGKLKVIQTWKGNGCLVAQVLLPFLQHRQLSFDSELQMELWIIEARFRGEELSWGGKVNLGEENQTRKAYISALIQADHGDYKPLIAFAKS